MPVQLGQDWALDQAFTNSALCTALESSSRQRTETERKLSLKNYPRNTGAGELLEEYKERHQIDPGQVQSLFFSEGPGAMAVELLPIPVTDSYVKIAHLLGSDLLSQDGSNNQRHAPDILVISRRKTPLAFGQGCDILLALQRRLPAMSFAFSLFRFQTILRLHRQVIEEGPATYHIQWTLENLIDYIKKDIR